MAEKLIIIDGSSYFFRAYFAIQRLSTSKGFPTNAIYGFINMLARVLEVEKPSRLVIAFDTPKPSFRKALYDEYKANRERPPEDLVVQIPHILRAVDAFKIKRMQLEGFEADDVIATLTEQAVKDGYEVDIITGDKDLMQLVTDKVTLFDTMKDKRIGPQGVVEKFGVRPDQVVDFLALMGDASDNIPGVTGIGEKTAAELIRTYETLDGIYLRLAEIKQEKRRKSLEDEKKIAYLSKELATVKRDVDLNIDWEEFRYSGPDSNALRDIFQEFEFTNLIKRFQLAPVEKAPEKLDSDYLAVQTEAQLSALVKELKKAALLAVDTETTSLSIQEAKLVGISLSLEPNRAYYLPVAHHVPRNPFELAPGQLEESVVREALRPFLEDPQLPKIGQNLKYDLQILRNWGVTLKGIAADTLLESYLLDPDGSHGLDAMALKHLGHQNITYDEITKTGKTQISFAEVPIDVATRYSGEDADITLRLHHLMFPTMKVAKLDSLFKEIEMPLIEVLADMEYNGLKIDEPRLREMSDNLSVDLAAVEDKIYELGGGAFNINSPKQLSQILFEKLKLPVIRKTKTGISTDESVLQALCGQHPICEWILKFREFMKLKSTYVEGLLAQIAPQTGRVHTHFNQALAVTGRLSSSNPNLQNIPTASDPRYDIRNAFIPSLGGELLSSDYSQVELRLLADFSSDKELLRAFENNEDIHSYTARLIFNTKEVTSDQRKVAKTINFGVVYGQTPFGLSQTLKIPPKDAKEFIDKYFERYSMVKDYLHSLVEDARKHGYAATRLGRRRFLPEITSQNRMRREMAERAAINMPLQGTAADMIKIAMVRIYKRLIDEDLKSKMILQVHDELVFDVLPKEKEAVEALVRSEMENALKLKIPLVVDMGWGKNWRECD